MLLVHAWSRIMDESSLGKRENPDYPSLPCVVVSRKAITDSTH